MRYFAIKSRLIAAVAAMFCSNGFVLGCWAATIPHVSDSLELSEFSLGLLLLFFAVGGIAAMFTVSTAIRALGSLTTTLAVGFIYAVLFVLIPGGQNSITVALLVVSFGAAHGAMDVAMNSHAVAREQQCGGRFLSAMHGFFSLSMAAGAIVAGWLLADGDCSTSDRFTLLAIGLSLLSIAWIEPKENFEGLSSSVDRATPHTTTVEKSTPVSRRDFGPLIALASIAFACLVAEGAMTDWLVKLTLNRGVPPQLASFVYASFGVGMAMGRFSGDLLSHRIQPRHIVGGGCLLAATTIAAFLTGGSLLAACIAMLVAGLGLANVIPIVFRSAGTRGHDRTNSIALVTACGYAGFLVGPPLIGFVAERTTLPIAFGLTTVGLSLAGILAYRSVVFSSMEKATEIRHAA